MTKPQIRFKVVLTTFSRKSKPFGNVCPPPHRSIQKKNSFDSQAIILRSHFETWRRSRMDRASLIFRVITLYSVGLSTVVWDSESYVGNYVKVQKVARFFENHLCSLYRSINSAWNDLKLVTFHDHYDRGWVSWPHLVMRSQDRLTIGRLTDWYNP